MSRPLSRHTYSRKRDLSPRQREVLRHVALAKSNKAIACDLGISERTVERLVDQACKWLGVRSRLAAVVRAGIVQINGGAS